MKELIHFVALQWKYQLKLKTILKNLYSFTNAVKIKIVMTATTQQDTKVMTFANSLLVTNKIYLNWLKNGAVRISMEYHCPIFSKYLVFQMKNLVFPSIEILRF